MSDDNYIDEDMEENSSFFDHEYIQEYPHEYNDVEIFQGLVELAKCEIEIIEETVYENLDCRNYENYDQAILSQKTHEKHIDDSDSILLTTNKFSEDERNSFYRFTYKNQPYHFNGHAIYDVLDYVVDIANIFLEKIEHTKRLSIIGDMYEEGGVEVIAIDLNKQD